MFKWLGLNYNMAEKEAIRILENGFIEAHEELKDLHEQSTLQQEHIYCLNEKMEKQRIDFQKEIKTIFVQTESVIGRLEEENQELRKELQYTQEKLSKKEKLIKELWLERSNM